MQQLRLDWAERSESIVNIILWSPGTKRPNEIGSHGEAEESDLAAVRMVGLPEGNDRVQVCSASP